MTIDQHSDTAIAWAALPPTITAYLTAHRNRDVAAAVRLFADDAIVVDEGHAHWGRGEIEAWLGAAGGEYTFTTDFTGATTVGSEDVDVVQRLEGDFPGGVADLHYRFRMRGALISHLVIAP